MTFSHGSGTRAGLISLAACFGVYLLFAGTLSLSEVVTGALLGTVGAAGTGLLTRISPRHFAFSPGHIRVWSRAFRSVPPGTARTGIALAASLLRLHNVSGRADTQPFGPGRTDAPADRARRATAVLATSLAPNTFVLNIPLQRHEALLHGIDGETPQTNPEWLT